jgi:hypothetical protein
MEQGAVMALTEDDRSRILAFVDTVVPPRPCNEVWLVGSRAEGTERPDSDWDVLVFTIDAPSDPSKLFYGNQKATVAPGFVIELVWAHPCLKGDSRRYLQGYRNFGIRLR